jgi:exopolysaccharide biosynthesis polyprenyl glycosylphosphotransferase
MLGTVGAKHDSAIPYFSPISATKPFPALVAVTLARERREAVLVTVRANRASLSRRPPLPVAREVGWLTAYARSLMLIDFGAVLLAAALALWVRFGGVDERVGGVPYYAVVVVITVLWMLVLGMSRCYEPRFLGSGPEEYRRVFNASIRLTAVVAFLAYSLKLDIARGFVAIALPVGAVLLLLGRWGSRRGLHLARLRGEAMHRVLVLGRLDDVSSLSAQLDREPLAGLQVVGACVAGAGEGRELSVGGRAVPVVGSLADVRGALAAVRADTLAVAASPGVTAEALRRLSYELEGTGVDLLVAPALTNVTGSRISIRPVAGLPLLHVDEPELTGARKLVKGVFDRLISALLVVGLAPLLVGVALAVRVSSPGPVLFTQTRVGRDGELFSVRKFRSMYDDAEARLAALRDLNEHDGVLFKMRNDPRVTRVGRFLRRYSLDELPQLLNVLRGEMSLVGPRPPLPSEVERYQGHAHRRLLVKPGITGLWQVSGRSDLSWDDAVRLDLEYVENWSLGMDLLVLARTVMTVLSGKGAY